MSLKVKVSFKDFDIKLTDALAGKIDELFNRRKVGLETRVKNIILKYIRRSTTYKSITRGVLIGPLGILESKEKMEEILKILSNSIFIKYNPITKRRIRKFFRSVIVDGVFTINVMPSDLNELLDLDAGMYVSEHGHLVEWLKWLLTEGNSPVVLGYKFLEGPFDKSRTDKGIMIPAKVGFWKVPQQHSGTLRDNFITRALDFNSEKIAQEISLALQKRLIL